MPTPSSKSRIAEFYAGYIKRLGHLQDVLLLLIRLYWGSTFAIAGWGKLANPRAAAQFFSELGIPMPMLNALLSGSVEFAGGIMLLAGLAARVVTVPLVLNMIVAYLTAHRAEAFSLFSAPYQFVTAPPFLHLLASLFVLAFGPGVISIDHLLGRYLARRRRELAPSAGTAAGGCSIGPAILLDRRRMAQLTGVAVVGLAAGAMLRGLSIGSRSAGSEASTSRHRDGADASSLSEIDAASPAGIQPSLMLREPHVCRGLNACKGLGKSHNNECAGRGSCATAASHACNGLNDCKGQGGCGEYPGQNQCNGKGSCAVPLKKETWGKARRVFEKLMAAQKKTVGNPQA